MLNEQIRVEVVYANTKGYKVISTQIPWGATILQAIEASGILVEFPEINLQNRNAVGIYGSIKPLDYKVEEGDQIEIYCPLPQSAMEARKAKVKEQKLKLQKAKYPL